MSIDSRYIQPGVAVMVSIGRDENPGKIGPVRWRCGVIVEITGNGHAYGPLVHVDIAPSQEAGVTTIKRYAKKDRIRLATLDEAQAFAERRTTASLLAQQPVGDTSLTNLNAPTVRRCRLYEEDMKPVSLHQPVINAILSHPDIAKAVNQLFRESGDALVSKHQAVVYKGELLEQANKKLAEDLQLSQTSLKSCDTERRTLLRQQDELQRAYNNVNAELTTTKSNIRSYSLHNLLSQIGKERGFILWNPKSKIAPQEVYPTLDMAETVQKSMCQRYPNQLFHIMPIGPGAMLKTVTQLVSA